MEARGVAGVACTVGVVAFVAGMLVGWQAGSSGGTTSAAPAVETAPTTAPETTAPRQKRSRAERLLAEYACWTDEIPAGQSVPTHAVVTLPGQRAELVDADIGFAIWLDGAPGVLHGFCP
jgi:hypothetical protein